MMIPPNPLITIIVSYTKLKDTDALEFMIMLDGVSYYFKNLRMK